MRVTRGRSAAGEIPLDSALMARILAERVNQLWKVQLFLPVARARPDELALKAGGESECLSK